jgi:hypothetical protein
MAPAGEHLPSKHEALSSNYRTAKKKKKVPHWSYWAKIKMSPDMCSFLNAPVICVLLIQLGARIQFLIVMGWRI